GEWEAEWNQWYYTPLVADERDRRRGARTALVLSAAAAGPRRRSACTRLKAARPGKGNRSCAKNPSGTASSRTPRRAGKRPGGKEKVPNNKSQTGTTLAKFLSIPSLSQEWCQR